MIEGIRLWPWVGAAAQKTDLAIADCDSCMQNNSREIRQQMGCGYEAPVDNPSSMWEPPASEVGFRQNPKTVRLPTVCPGYSTKLPEVFEVIRSRAHWLHGSLRDFCDGKANEGLLIGIEVLDSEINAVQTYEVTPEAEGGGRK